jgi:hypothetical protein
VPSLTYPSTKEECAANKAKIESAVRDALPPAEAEAFMAKSQAFEYASLACEQEEFQLAVINGRLVLQALLDKLNPKPPKAPKVVDPECGKYWIEDCGDESGVDEPQPSGGCFITTACCQIVGLSDDCFELRMLRRYRDRVLSRTPDGQRDVERYYATAPAILDSMRGERRERELLTLYFTHILPSALLASLGFDRAARRLYTHMMDGLTRRHHSSV